MLKLIPTSSSGGLHLFTSHWNGLSFLCTVISQNPLQKNKMLSFVHELLGLAATVEFITQWSDFVRCSWDQTKPEIISPLIRKTTVSALHVFPKLQLDAVFWCSNLLVKSFLPICWFNTSAGRLQLFKSPTSLLLCQILTTSWSSELFDILYETRDQNLPLEQLYYWGHISAAVHVQ